MSSLSPDDLSLLTDPQTAALVEKHLGEEPAGLALRLKCGRDRARLVCQQVKYLGRAKTKLPSYHSARCIIPPLPYEQCSSEAAAASKRYGGRLCIDLTGGLGVDSYYFSRSFDRVITVERDPVLARVERYNFDRLDAGNITVENTSAEAFLAAYSGLKADLIYLDPARRSEGERVFLLQDCSPDVVGLMPLLLEKAQRVLIKLSPLFDVQEALRVFAGHVSKLEIVSIGGDVRELLVELTPRPEKTEVGVNRNGEQRFVFRPGDISRGADEIGSAPEEYPFLLIPDAAFYKGRLVAALFRQYFPELHRHLSGQNGFAFARELPESFPGRAYRIIGGEPYSPKRLKKKLKEQGVKRINLLRRDFPHSSEEIKQALGVREGGTEWFAFTEIGGKPMVFRVEPAL